MARARTLVSAGAAGGSYVEWSAVIAGAIGASAISFLLLTFGGAVGLTLTSPLPNASGLSAWGTVFAVAWWAILVQIGSFFVGGYLAGRMRPRWGTGTLDESRFRDGAHGFMVWAVGILLGALVLAWVGGATLKTATQAASTLGGGAAAGLANNNQSNPGADYAADLLLRPTPRTGTAAATPASASANQNDPATRNAVRRIFASTISNRELTARDRDYLSEVVASRTGLSQAEAQSRVDSTVQDVQKFENEARQTAEKARRYALISGFLAAASLLISLAAAVGGAHLGGLHRDEGTVAHLFGHRFW
jgi:hypothetical protein